MLRDLSGLRVRFGLCVLCVRFELRGLHVRILPLSACDVVAVEIRAEEAEQEVEQLTGVEAESDIADKADGDFDLGPSRRVGRFRRRRSTSSIWEWTRSLRTTTSPYPPRQGLDDARHEVVCSFFGDSPRERYALADFTTTGF